MGRNSGGNRDSGRGNRLMQSVFKSERSIRMNKFETLIAFDAKGKVLFSKKGEQYEVSGLSNNELRALNNAIVTHNHPRSLGERGVRAIGNSFGDVDLSTAIANNVREIRAVTPTYTFSMKRPKGGWGVSVEKFRETHKKVNREVRAEFERYLWNQGYSDEAIARVETRHYHEVNKRLAKLFGWNYSKRRG